MDPESETEPQPTVGLVIAANSHCPIKFIHVGNLIKSEIKYAKVWTEFLKILEEKCLENGKMLWYSNLFCLVNVWQRANLIHVVYHFIVAFSCICILSDLGIQLDTSKQVVVFRPNIHKL